MKVICTHLDDNKFDCLPEWEVGNEYKLSIIKPIRHTDRFKATLESEYGEVNVHCDKSGNIFDTQSGELFDLGFVKFKVKE